MAETCGGHCFCFAGSFYSPFSHHVEESSPETTDEADAAYGNDNRANRYWRTSLNGLIKRAKSRRFVWT